MTPEPAPPHAWCTAAGSSCLWQHVKWTPYELSIASEELSEWVEDVRLVVSHAQGCPSFLFTLRFVMVRGARALGCTRGSGTVLTGPGATLAALRPWGPLLLCRQCCALGCKPPTP